MAIFPSVLEGGGGGGGVAIFPSTLEGGGGGGGGGGLVVIFPVLIVSLTIFIVISVSKTGLITFVL